MELYFFKQLFSSNSEFIFLTNKPLNPISGLIINGNLTAVDNCAGNITVGGVDTVDNSNPCNVIITRAWTFTDDCGNTSSVVQTITVIDTTAPELTSDLDTDLTVSCANVPEIPNLKFTDNCSSNVDVVFDETNSFDEALLNDYEIIRTWTVSDACGNKNTYTQTLYVTLDEVVTIGYAIKKETIEEPEKVDISAVKIRKNFIKWKTLRYLTILNNEW